MFETCLVLGDCDWTYETIKHEPEAVDGCPQPCCECAAEIPPGQPHDLFVGRGPDTTDTFRTCRTCMSIWESLAGGSRMFRGLSELLMGSYGVGLTRLPRSEDAFPDFGGTMCLASCEYLTVRDKRAWCSAYQAALTQPRRGETLVCYACAAGSDWIC